MSIPKKDQVYTTLSHNVYRGVNDRIGSFRGYAYQKDLSTDEVGVWYDRANDEVVVSYRGSTTKEDWIKTDVDIAKGTFYKSARAARNKEVDDRVRRRFPRAKYVYAGHSMGGTSALYQAHLTNSRAVVVNPGLSVKKEPWSKSPNSSQDTVIYRTSKDAVSAASAIHSYKTVKVDVKNTRKSVTTRIAEDVATMTGPVAVAVFQTAQEQNQMHSSDNFTFYEDEGSQDSLGEQIYDKFQTGWRAVFLGQITYSNLAKALKSESRAGQLLRHYANKFLGDGRGAYSRLRTTDPVDAEGIAAEDLEIVEESIKDSYQAARAFEAEYEAAVEAGEGFENLSEGASIFAEGVQASNSSAIIGVDMLSNSLGGGLGATVNAVAQKSGIGQRIGQFMSKMIDKGVRAVTNANTAEVVFNSGDPVLDPNILDDMPTFVDEEELDEDLADVEDYQGDPDEALNRKPPDEEKYPETDEENMEEEDAGEIDEVEDAADVVDEDLLTGTFDPQGQSVFEDSKPMELDDIMKEVDMDLKINDPNAYDFEVGDFADFLADPSGVGEVATALAADSAIPEAIIVGAETAEVAGETVSTTAGIIASVKAATHAVGKVVAPLILPLMVVCESVGLGFEIDRISGNKAEEERLGIAMRGKDRIRDFDDSRFVTGIWKNTQKMYEDFQDDPLHEYFFPQLWEGIKELGSMIGDTVHVLAPVHFVEKLIETVRDQEEGINLEDHLEVLSKLKEEYSDKLGHIRAGTYFNKDDMNFARLVMKQHMKKYSEMYYTTMAKRLLKEETDIESIFEEKVLKGEALVYDHHIISFAQLNFQLFNARLDETITFLPPKGSPFYPYKRSYMKVREFFFNVVKPRIDAGHYTYIYSIFKFHLVWSYEREDNADNQDYWEGVNRNRSEDEQIHQDIWTSRQLWLKHFQQIQDHVNKNKAMKLKLKMDEAMEKLKFSDNQTTRQKALAAVQAYDVLNKKIAESTFLGMTDFGILLEGDRTKDMSIKSRQLDQITAYIEGVRKGETGQGSNIFWFAREVWLLVSGYLNVGPYMVPCGYPMSSDDYGIPPYHPKWEDNFWGVGKPPTLEQIAMKGGLSHYWQVKRDPAAQKLLNTLYYASAKSVTRGDFHTKQKKIAEFINKLDIFNKLYKIIIELLSKKLGVKPSHPGLIPFATKIMQLHAPQLKQKIRQLQAGLLHSSHDTSQPETSSTSGSSAPIKTKSPKGEIIEPQTNDVNGKRSHTVVNNQTVHSGPGEGKKTTKSTTAVQKKQKQIYRNTRNVLNVRPTKFQRTSKSRFGGGRLATGGGRGLSTRVTKIDTGFDNTSYWGRL